ncbi:MAG TPA: tetratricopeptide repeat protein [Gemmatimonadaceae bacterium]|nr:tetratricopeptide repeat protein [Gemmatimonadaceae bacterium]
MLDQFARARELVAEARSAEQRGQTTRALSLYDDALSHFDESRPEPLYADTLRWKGTVLRERGDTDEAHRLYARSLRVAERSEAIGSQAHALNCLAIVAQRRGDSGETEKLYGRAADLASKAGESRLLGMIEQNRGVLAAMRGDLANAEIRYSKSLSAFEGAQDREAVSWVLNNLGMLYTKKGDFEKARDALEKGLAIAQGCDPTVESILTLNLAEAWVGAGRLDLADQACGRALRAAQRRGDHLTAASALKCRARIERARGALDKAMATLRIAIYEAEGTEDRLLHAEMLRELGEVARALGNAGGAKSAFREAATTYDVVGAKGEAEQVKSLIAELGD